MHTEMTTEFQTPLTELKELFESHGLSCALHKEWLVPNGEFPAVRALWHPRETSGRLDVQVWLNKEVCIEECFGGVGSGSQGMRNAFENFAVNSFHVLLAAIWHKNDPDQVTTEQWMIGGQPFTAYIGNFGTRASENGESHVPGELFPAIERAVKSLQLSGDTHWARFFFCNLNGEQTFEALLDNREWEGGLICLKSIPWMQCAGYYSVRLFMVLRAEGGAMTWQQHGPREPEPSV